MADFRRVRLTRSGGFAGITRRYEIDAGKLDANQRRTLEELLVALEHLSANKPSKGHPDRFQFEIEVESAGGVRQWRIGEAGAAPAQKALID